VLKTYKPGSSANNFNFQGQSNVVGV